MADAPAPDTTTRTSSIRFLFSSRAEEGGAGDDGRPVLIVVEAEDLHLLWALLDDEALGRLDVLEVDAAESGLERLHHNADLVDLLGVDVDVEDVDVREALEQDALALHHRLAGVGPDVAQAQHRRAVRDDGHQISTSRVRVREVRVLGDLEAGLGDAGGVGEREITRGGAGLRGDDLDLPLAAAGDTQRVLAPYLRRRQRAAAGALRGNGILGHRATSARTRLQFSASCQDTTISQARLLLEADPDLAWRLTCRGTHRFLR
jgi:hypothetical protein